MRVIIRLEDNDGKMHKRTKITLNDQVTIEGLQRELASIFSIEPKFQCILFGESQIDLLEGPLSQVVTGTAPNVLLLKHSLLDDWDAFKLCSDAIDRNKRNEHNAKKNVKNCIEHLEELNKDKFFLAYPKLRSIELEFNNKYAHYLDTDHDSIKIAARCYFSKLFGNTNVEIAFKPKETSGAQGGLICEVSKSGAQAIKYHIKSHLGSRTSNHTAVDLRELFVYKLLELIKVGPEVHFLMNIHESRFGLYIATEDVAGFTQTSKAKIDEEQMKQQMLKLNLLRHILFLLDLHSGNYGIDGEGNLSIIDFQVGNHQKSTDGFLESCKDHAKHYIESWALLSKFDEADHAIAEQKDTLDAKCINRKLSENYAEYFNRIKVIVQNAVQ